MKRTKFFIPYLPGQRMLTICIVIILLSSVLINFFPSIKPSSTADAISDWTATSHSDFEDGTFNNSSLEVKLIEVELACTNFLGEWNKKDISTPPHPRTEHGLAPIWGTDKIFLFGGIDYSTRYNDVWIYNVTNNTWTIMDLPAPEKPSARYRQGGASIWGTDQVLIYGGAGGNFETWVYDYSENKWYKKNQFTGMDSRAACQMTSIWGTGKVLIFGGVLSDNQYTNDTWIYDSKNNTWNETIPENHPEGRWYYAMASIHGTDKLLLYGGEEYNRNKIFQDTWIYDLSDNNWTNMSTINNPGLSKYMEMAPIWGTDKILLFGKRIDNSGYETWLYDYGNNSWMNVHSQTQPYDRYWFEMTSIWGENRVILFGGQDASKPFVPGNAFSDTWIYTPYKTNRYFNGTYISKPFDTQTNSTFRTISWNGNTSINTTIKIQFRTASTELELNLTNFTGPDGATNSFYISSPTTIWSGHEIDRWMQFKIYLNTTNYLESPKLDSIKIVYNNIPSTNLFNPLDEGIIATNKPMFVWNFTDLDSAQQTMFQVLIDDDLEFGSIDYDSGVQNSNNQNWQFPEGTAYTTIPDGIWFWKVRTKDNDGDWGYYSEPWKLTIDTKRPYSMIQFPVDYGCYNNLSAIFGSAFEAANGTGLKKLEISIQELDSDHYWSENGWIMDETWLNVTGIANWTYYSYDVNWTSGVRYHIRSRAIDFAGNIETPGSGVKFIMDWEKPESIVVTPVRNLFLNSINTISGTSFDIGGSGIDLVEIYVEQFKGSSYWTGTGWEPDIKWLQADGTESWSFDSSSISWTTGYEYGICSRAVDNAGNIGDPGDMVNITYDNGKPYSFIELPKNNSFLNKIEAISGRSSDDESFVNDRVEISIHRLVDDKYWTGTDWAITEAWLIAEGTSTWFFNASAVQWLTDVSYNVHSRAVDLAGNIEMPPDEIIFMYDDRPPEDLLISINYGRGYTFLNIVSLQLNATDHGSGVDQMSFSSDGVTWIPWETFDKVTSYTLTGPEGIKSIFYKVIDRAGNTASTSDTIILDFTPPEEVSISINDDAVYTNKNDVVLELNAVDTLSGVDMMSFSIDGLDTTSWEKFSQEKNVTLGGEDGEKLIVFLVSDKAGNIATASDTIILDTKPPESLWININNGAESTDSNSVALNLFAIDVTSEVNMMSFSFDNITWSDWIKYSTTIKYNLTNKYGEVTVYFRVNDLVGNIAEPVTDTIFLNITSQDDGGANKPMDEQAKDTRGLIIILIILLILSMMAVYFYFKRKRRAEREAEIKKEMIEQDEVIAELTEGATPLQIEEASDESKPALEQPSIPTPVPMPIPAPKPILPQTTMSAERREAGGERREEPQGEEQHVTEPESPEPRTIEPEEPKELIEPDLEENTKIVKEDIPEDTGDETAS